MARNVVIPLIWGLLLLAISKADLDPYLRTLYIGAGETSRIIRKIYENYDPYTRPKPPGGGPTKIGIFIGVMELQWRDDDLYLKGTYERRWVDERLKFDVKPGGRDRIVLDLNDFEKRIWMPETYLITHHAHDRWGRGLIEIFSNGTVHDKHLGTTRIHLPESSKNQKSGEAVFVATDFRYDKRGMDMDWDSHGCLIVHDEGKVKLKDVKCFKTIKTVNNRDFEHININFTVRSNIP